MLELRIGAYARLTEYHTRSSNKFLTFSDYHEIDWQKHVLNIQQLSDEQQRLKEGSDLLQE
jgi:hypothetical protein